MTDKQQDKFEKHCSTWLNLNIHLPKARAEYQKAFNAEPIEYKKANAGARAMNLYLLDKLKEVGADNWKDEAQPTAKRVNLNAVKQADKSLVAYKGNGKRPAHMKIDLG